MPLAQSLIQNSLPNTRLFNYVGATSYGSYTNVMWFEILAVTMMGEKRDYTKFGGPRSKFFNEEFSCPTFIDNEAQYSEVRTDKMGLGMNRYLRGFKDPNSRKPDQDDPQYQPTEYDTGSLVLTGWWRFDDARGAASRGLVADSSEWHLSTRPGPTSMRTGVKLYWEGMDRGSLPYYLNGDPKRHGDQMNVLHFDSHVAALNNEESAIAMRDPDGRWQAVYDESLE